MDLEKIEGLVKIVENSSLTEFSIRDGETEITMSKLTHQPVIAACVPAAPLTAAPAQPTAAEEKAEAADEFELILAPIVGTFYSAAAPDVPAYVKVGDHVKAGQTVCILEAMKLMNEIQADYDCEIEAVLVSNEQKVEYGQPLFRVKKL